MRRLLTILIVSFVLSLGCSTSNWMPGPRCNGEPRTVDTRTWQVAVVDHRTRCLSLTKVLADRASEAETCVETQLRKQSPTPNQPLPFTIQAGATVKIISFAFYNPSLTSGFHCSTQQIPSLSAEDAAACVRLSCTNCAIKDITAPVAADSSKLASWCRDNPKP